MTDPQTGGLEGIAIIGMAGRFPRSRDLRELWRNLREGLDCVSTFSDEELEAPPPPEILRDPRFVKARGVLEDADLFDASFFDISPRQAELMDPQNRLFLECAHQALEDAGYDPERFPGPIGVFGGVTLSSYFLYNLMSQAELLRAAGGYQIALGTDRDYLTTFVSYKLGLRGPSLDVQTACSTSLVATALACQSLLSYNCDLALAGGVSVKVPQRSGYLYTPGGLDSATGRCRSFDASADGSVYGSGVGIVVLKRLEEALADGDEIRAVILGSALNNDGSAKVGFTAPGVEGQAEVISMAQALAGVDPETLGYVECHGSGTALGDPIEVTALTKAFRAGNPETERRNWCAIGSIKSNVGHCSAAAGVAGLIKTALMLEHREIVPTLHFEKPNPVIDFGASPFYVADRLAPWPADDEPRRAGVSSFGLGGTNVHVVLQEAPVPEPSGPSRPWQLLLLSAKTETALETATDNLVANLERQPERSLADVAFTLQVGRRVFAHRRLLVCRDGEDAVRALRERDPRRVLSSFEEASGRPVAFLLPGVGDHYPGMARGLYDAEPVFREHLDRCAELLAPRLGVDLRELLFPADLPAGEGSTGPDLRRLLGRGGEPGEAARRLHRTLYAQPAVFAVEYALARLWMAWGIRPEALLGYSLGEYTAACLAGVLSLEDALALVAERARLIDGLPAGAMVAVPLPESRLRPLLADAGLDLAAINAPEVCVVAGPVDAVAALEEKLAGEGIASRRLPTTHAFHSRMMEPVTAALTRLAQGLRLSPPKIPYISNVTGAWITPAEATDPGYWARHLVQTVRFGDGLAALWKNPSRVLLETGPGFGLSTLALQQAGDPERLAFPAMRNEHDRQDDQAFILGALGKLWLAGVRVDWSGFYAGERRRRVRLPTYPFERQRFWVEARPPQIAQVDDTFRLADGRRVSFEEAAELARTGELELVEDPSVLRRLARLRELETLGAKVTAPPAGEAAGDSSPEVVPAAGARHSRPRLRNAWVEPAGGAERRIADMFGELLGISGVGAHDSFFELGGHSLLGISLLARLREAFGADLELRTLFEQPTPAGLAAILSERAPAGRVPPPLVPMPRDGELPLSFPQQRLWFLDQLMPGNPFYNLSGGVRLEGALDIPAMHAAVREVVRRHESLRTGFPSIEGRPVQWIVPLAEAGVELPLVDLSGLPAATREAELRRIATERASQPFDLSRPGLLRLTLLRLTGEDEAEHALLFAIHHIVSDAWSQGVLIGEVATLYAAFSQGQPSRLPELPVQYADFAVWQRRWLSGEVLEDLLAWWRERLAGAPTVELPTDHPRPPVQTFRGANLRAFYPGLAAGVARVAGDQGATPFMVLLAAFQTLLARVSGQEDLVVGTPVANRTQRGAEGLIGFFVNTLVLRTDASGDPDFATLIGRVRETALGAFGHSELPFEQLVEELQPRRDLSRNPLFQVAFNLLNTPPPQAEVSTGLRMAPLSSPGGTSLFDLQPYVTEVGDDLAVGWEYATDLFDASTIERLAGQFATLLEGALADPGRRLWDLPWLSAAEQAQLAAWNDMSVAYPLDGDRPGLHHLIEEQVARAPEAPAVSYEGETLTYAELDARANRLARKLLSLGAGVESRVAVALDRSVELVVALLATLKAGAAYVPLDPDYPQDRLTYMLEDARPALVLTRAGLADRLPATEAPTLQLEPGGAESVDFDGSPLDLPVVGSQLAYMIYTSGSTGRPKGAMVHHRAIRNRLLWMQDAYRLTSADTVLQKTPFSFDVSVWEFFWPLLTGARLAVAAPGEHRDAATLAARIRREGVTVLHFVPSMLQVFLEEPSAAACTSIRLIVASGEALPPELARRCLEKLPWAALENLYGPTEAAVDVTFHSCTLEDVRSVPIGRPIANTTIHLVDRGFSPVPVGVPGELCIGGVNVGRGYLGRPDLTAEKFVSDPFSAEPGARLYRTGDLARRLPDGEIDFLGRLDHQVKVRGFRIELGEIETALAAFPGVREVVVVARRDEEGGPGSARLVAYLVPEAGTELKGETVGELRAWLAARLPEPMIPSLFVPLERMPLSPNGKIDRRALPDPGAARPALSRVYEAPATPTEERLAEIWAAVLKIDKVGRKDDFFEIGGHSLLATQVVARVRDAFRVELPLPAVFQAPTLERLGARIDALMETTGGVAAAPTLQPRRRERRAEDLRSKIAGLSEAEVQELLRRKRAAESGGEDRP